MTRIEKLETAIKQGYTYDCETGKVFNRHGKELTFIASNGYKTITNSKINQLTHHQFAWYYTYGKMANFLDHINRDKLDNRIENLREVTIQQNNFNVNCKGYYFNKIYNMWQAQINFNNKKIFLGRFDTETEAEAAYKQAKQQYHTYNV